jgi:hypothetical protein
MTPGSEDSKTTAPSIAAGRAWAVSAATARSTRSSFVSLKTFIDNTSWTPMGPITNDR